MIKNSLFLFLCFLILVSCSPKKTIDINHKVYDSVEKIVKRINLITIPDRQIILSDYANHKPDEEGSFDFRPAFQKAIDELSSQGGGHIVFTHSKGFKAWVKQTEIYRFDGPIELKSNIQIDLQPAIRLFFKFNPLAYSNNKKGTLSRYEGTSIYGYTPLFYAFNAQNIVFKFTGGNGAVPEINGDGEKWIKWQVLGESKKNKSTTELVRDVNNLDWPVSKRRFANPDSFFLRPSMFEFLVCKNILFDGFKMTNAPFWLIHPVFSENMTFRNLFFDVGLVNNDGFDIESSKDVLIENIIFNNHDDNIVIKAGRDKEGRDGAIIAGTEYETIQSPYIKNGRITGISENIVGRNCICKGHNALCVGSEMSGGVRNIYFVDNIAPQNIKNGVYIKSSRRRGGTVENIFVVNLKLNIVNDNVISLNPNYDGDTSSPYVSEFKNIYIDNVSAANASNGIRVYGWKDLLIKNVQLTNIVIKLIPNAKNKFEFFNVSDLYLKNVIIDNKKIEGTFNNISSNKYLIMQK